MGSTNSRCSILPWTSLLEKGNAFGDGDALGLCRCEELGVRLGLSSLGSLVSLLLVHLSNLKQRNPQKLRGFSGLSCYSVTLALVERSASSCGHFIHLLSILSVKMLLFWMQTCLVMRHMVICRPPVTIAFTHHSHADLLFLQTEPVFACLSAARILFVSCFFVFSSCGCWDKWASHSQQLIECDFFWARRHLHAFILAGPEQSSLVSSVFPLLPLLLLSSLSLPFLADG